MSVQEKSICNSDRDSFRYNSEIYFTDLFVFSQARSRLVSGREQLGDIVKIENF